MNSWGFFLLFILSCLLPSGCASFADDYDYPYDASLSQITGLKIPENFQINQEEFGKLYNVSLPEIFDLRDVGLTPVKNQGLCGACWSFAATSILQDIIKIKTGREVLLSDQDLLDCNTEGWNCRGGFIPNDYFFRKGKMGATDGNEYPYQGRQNMCRRNVKPIEKISSWHFVDQRMGRVEGIKQAIFQHGPVWAGIYAGPRFQQFRGGTIFSQCEYQQPNHAVEIVGWGKDHFIIKNSWGAGWADEGYARVAYNCNNLGDYANYMIYKDGETPEDPSENKKNICIGENKSKSRTSMPIEITVYNRTQIPVEIFWLDYTGKRQFVIDLASWQARKIRTQKYHPFVAIEKKTRRCLELWQSAGDTYWGIQ